MRVALLLEYDGSRYHGWQSQPELRTVQETVEKAISFVADEPVSVVCSGRTDTGVHASHQIIHFDTEKERPPASWVYGVNSNLPKDICVRWAREMPDDFHARFSATSRSYSYVIYNSPVRPALMQGQVTWQYRQLDDRLMNKAAKYLSGEHDFTSFRAMTCQAKTPVRKVTKLKVWRKENWVVIDITANAFLHHMVRNIAGVLIAVGTSRKPVSWVESVLNARDRRMGAETASAFGLYLVDVVYPKKFSVVSGNKMPVFLTG